MSRPRPLPPGGRPQPPPRPPQPRPAAHADKPAEPADNPAEPANPKPDRHDITDKAAARRLRVITIDQALAGASNVFMTFLAAHVLGVSAFGLYGVVFLVFIVVQGVSRALICDPLLVHTDEAETRTNEILGNSVVVATALSTAVLLAGIAAQQWSLQLGNALIVLGLCLPLLALQDLGRYLGFALARPGWAVILDSAWLVLMIGAVAALFATDHRTLPWFIAAWAGSGAVTGFLTLWQHRERGLHLSFRWLRYTWPFSWRYLISYTSTQGAALAGTSAVGGIVGTKALGAVQGSVFLVRPFGLFQVAAVAAGTSEISRAKKAGPPVRRFALKNTRFALAAALINGVVILVLPDKLGRLVLSDTWEHAKPLLLATAVQILCLAVITGGRTGLLGMRAARKTVVIDVVTTLLVLIATVLGAVVNGVLGVLWAVSITQGLMAVVWWAVLWDHTAKHLTYPTDAAPEAGFDEPADADAITDRLPVIVPPMA